MSYSTVNLTRRTALAGAAALIAVPSVIRASNKGLERLVLQAPRSGPGILLAHAEARGLLEPLADEVDLSVWTTPDDMRAGFVSGKVPLTVMSSQGAASLYNKGLDLEIVSVLTDGHCGLIARGIKGCSVADLRGKKIAVPSINGFTGHMFRLALRYYGIAEDELEILAAATKMEGAQLLLAGRAEVALVPEPVASAALMKGKAQGQDLYRGEQMRDVMGKITGTEPSLPQASLVARKGFAAAYPDVLSALQAALAEATISLNADPAAAAADAAPFLERKAALLEMAIPYANLNAQAAIEARPKLEALYTALLEADAKIIGGRMPDAGLYGL
ncbi:MAG: ABC transporter substrate-binding protein [Rhodobacteraceae bacterium]|nr:ABC transporter substrate-binding protein [Paracoccaceae bacterium]MCW9043075.1 ABC transporter substrate-binding protein [Pseudopelagicola sp.]